MHGQNVPTTEGLVIVLFQYRYKGQFGLIGHTKILRDRDTKHVRRQWWFGSRANFVIGGSSSRSSSRRCDWNGSHRLGPILGQRCVSSVVRAKLHRKCGWRWYRRRLLLLLLLLWQCCRKSSKCRCCCWSNITGWWVTIVVTANVPTTLIPPPLIIIIMGTIGCRSFLCGSRTAEECRIAVVLPEILPAVLGPFGLFPLYLCVHGFNETDIIPYIGYCCCCCWWWW